MLYGNISRNSYGNAMIGRYGGCFEEEYLGLCVGEQSPPTGFGCTGEICTNSQCEKGKCTVPKRLANMDGGRARKRNIDIKLRDYSKPIINTRHNANHSKRVHGSDKSLLATPTVARNKNPFILLSAKEVMYHYFCQLVI